MPTTIGSRTLNPYLAPSIGQVVPQLGNLTSSATGILQSELGGMPSPAEARTANAAWGAGAGLSPSSGMDFLGQRGGRLYRSEIEQRRRQGLQDLLSFLRGYSGTVAATPGQLMQQGQNEQQRFDDLMLQREAALAKSRRPKLEYSSQNPAAPWTDYRYFA